MIPKKVLRMCIPDCSEISSRQRATALPLNLHSTVEKEEDNCSLSAFSHLSQIVIIDKLRILNSDMECVLQRTKQPILPVWLSFSLSVAFVLSGITVIMFAYLTFQVVWRRPLNPIEQAVAEVADIGLQLDQEGPAPAPTLVAGEPTPTLIPSLKD